ncbi:MAG: polysaccharide biosynthesis protein PslG, partial [Chloroflexia bacterium]|nr:polysaccharide biosynthesis protein PslG [Chloroflexia bacterium]
MQARKAPLFLTTLLLMLALPLPQTSTRAQETTHTFPETGKTVRGIFLQYWTTHGGLAQQGYPISDEMMLKSTDGKEYRTQFFQRAVFEQHAEFAGTPNEVLLKLVGQTFYERHFQTTPPSNQAVNPTNSMTFKETGHGIGGKFRAYWEQHGGLAQQGYPMTDEFKMASTDGKEYTTQVFQRAVFELHPEFAGTENEVLLRLLGVEELEVFNKPAEDVFQGREVIQGNGWSYVNSPHALITLHAVDKQKI